MLEIIIIFQNFIVIILFVKLYYDPAYPETSQNPRYFFRFPHRDLHRERKA